MNRKVALLSHPVACHVGMCRCFRVFFIVLACVMMGCATSEYEGASGICPLPACSDWKYKQFAHEGIPIIGFHKPGRSPGSIVVYIEGDGNAWLSRSQVSSDPTPDDPVALRLALRVPDPGVLYLARPCQYVGSKLITSCDSSLWTTGRYSPEVIEAMDRAITDSKLSSEDRLTLVGYSGGGVIATLVASRRMDVDELVTVAAPLDISAWANHHQVSPLKDSLNPSEHVPALGLSREFHFHGGRDLVVPPAVMKRYRQRVSRANVHFFSVPEFDHQCCWVRDWPKLLAMIRKRAVHMKMDSISLKREVLSILEN